jgi:hypothetical protein
MSFAKSSRQRIPPLGNGNKMHMIGHKTPYQNFHLAPPHLGSQELQIRLAIFIGLKDIHGSNATLGNTVGIFRNNQSPYSSHSKQGIFFWASPSKKSVLCPPNLPNHAISFDY